MILLNRILSFPDLATYLGAAVPTEVFYADLLSTQAILEGFGALPDSGMIRFPLIDQTNFGGDARLATVLQVPLTIKTAPYLVHAAFQMVLEGVRISAEKPSGPWPLPATGGEWTLEVFEPSKIEYNLSRMRFADGSLVGNRLGRMKLLSRRGKRIDIDLLQPRVAVRVGVGRTTKEAGLLQHVFVGRGGQVGTFGYFFYFGHEAMEGLRVFLDLPQRAPIYQVAVVVSERIYRSDQYPPNQWNGSLKIERVRNDEFQMSAIPFPIVRLIGGSRRGRDFLIVSLRRHDASPSPFMGLNARLRETLWDFASRLTGTPAD